MSKTSIIAKAINDNIAGGKTVAQVKSELAISDDDWQRFSAKAYALNLEAEKKKRIADTAKPHVSTTSPEQVQQIIDLNIRLSLFAIIVPVTSTVAELNYAIKLAELLPASEGALLELVERAAMHPYFRALQKIGRFEQFPYFKVAAKMIDAATLSYYRRNYIACYLTLVPVIEGILLRWLGYDGANYQPDFDKLRRFFQNGYQRQPNPWNIEFHQLFCQACNELLARHFFRPTTSGSAHDLFNRHLAAHLLEDGEFATKANCLRLFMLLDAMTEIYFYESRGEDPRAALHRSQTEADMLIFTSVQARSAVRSPEDQMLNR